MRSGPAGRGARSDPVGLSLHAGPVWFDFQGSKSPQHPTGRLAGFRGHLQTDGASGLDRIGQDDGRIVHLGCWSHARRYFVKAVDAGETAAAAYLRSIDGLFRVERLARHFQLPPPRRAVLRQKRSLPPADALFASAAVDLASVPPKTRLGQALGYLLGQKASLRRCLTESVAVLDNNAVERAIRPLKLGAKNWLFIGHPNAGPRLAHLFTLVENCRLVGSIPRPTSSISSRVCPITHETHRRTAARRLAQSPRPGRRPSSAVVGDRLIASPSLPARQRRRRHVGVERLRYR